MSDKVKCWEYFQCDKAQCPAYQSEEAMCWVASGTHCRDEIQGRFLEKMEMCLECKLFKENMSVDSMVKTLKVVNRQFTEFRARVEQCDREAQGVSMELALGLSEAFEALKRISSGDPLVRIAETSGLELISKLKHIVNLTAENLGEMVDLSHEFAMGLAEHFNVLHRVSKGDLTAQVLGSSQLELLECLKQVTNQMIESVAREIRERKNAEEALRESEAKYSGLLENSLTGIYIDQDGRIVFANRRFAEIYGYWRRTLIGMESWRLVHPDDRALTNEMRAKRLKGQPVPSEYEAKGLTKDGRTIWIIRRNKRIEYEGRPAVLGNIVDITQRKRAEQALREREEELRKRHHELEAVNSILVRVTEQYDLNGMGRVLQDTMEEFYPKIHTLLFLLVPNGEGFYLPQGRRGQSKPTCYDRATDRIKDPDLEHDLLTLLTTEKVRPLHSGEKAHGPAIIQRLAQEYRAWMAVPIEVDEVCYGLFLVGSPFKDVPVEEDLIFMESLIRRISGVIKNQISKELREEAFKRQLTGPDKFMGIVGQSQPMQKIYRMIEAVSDSESTVLVTGESGTGKELLARAIHQAGKYRGTPFLAAHCSSFVPTLVHSELFGHEKGAFTGASKRKLGRLERAQGGILFLDEVADLPLETQVLLLRFLQDKSFERVGGEYPVEANVRIIAATNRQVEKELESGRLREDFYYRLNVVRIHVPPLRERIMDVPLLANHFLRTYCLIEGKEVAGFDTEAMQLIMHYHWPGNVRELQNTIARCVVLSSGPSIRAEDLPQTVHTPHRAATDYSLAKNERDLVLQVLNKCNWNKHETARVLGISRTTLYSKLKKHNIRPQAI
ncbi:MAG: sigma 54-interacting transcriptional regulator [Thermodesulfobacteriota bacterium]|nr:sigma 54-interacting transcriptional regulator [Thermodesulfobacteriota bacterium]